MLLGCELVAGGLAHLRDLGEAAKREATQDRGRVDQQRETEIMLMRRDRLRTKPRTKARTRTRTKARAETNSVVAGLVEGRVGGVSIPPGHRPAVDPRQKPQRCSGIDSGILS